MCEEQVKCRTFKPNARSLTGLLVSIPSIHCGKGRYSISFGVLGSYMDVLYGGNILQL